MSLNAIHENFQIYSTINSVLLTGGYGSGDV